MAVTDLTYGRQLQKLEDTWRALPEEEQPHLVVFMGMLSYKVIAVCDTEQEANEVLALCVVCTVIASLAKNTRKQRISRNLGLGMAIPGYTRNAYPHDFQVRTQASLDRLTDAILSSYH